MRGAEEEQGSRRVRCTEREKQVLEGEGFATRALLPFRSGITCDII